MSARASTTARPRGRPPVIATEQLLAIARDVFLEKGIRATTADVALRARVSEGTLFHRFKTKDALFRAAMKFDPSIEPPLFASLPERAGKGDLRANLTELGDQLLELGTIALPMMMMAWSNPASEFSFEKLAARSDARANRSIDALRRYFAAEQKRERISKRADPNVLARAFLGSLHHYCLYGILFPAGGSGQPTRAEYVKGLVDLLLDGALAPSPRRESKGPR
jgi:AcrR family transcriptional regulator